MVGGSSLGIGLTLFLRDQFTGPASRIKASSKDLQMQMRRMQEDQLRHQRNLSMGLAFGGAMALRGIGRQIKKASEFSYEMEFVKSITQATRIEQEKLLKIGGRLAGETMFYPQDIAEGMRFMSMAGMEATQVMQNIEGAVNLAGATMATLGGKGGAADIMTNVMKQFNIDFKYTKDVADILSYAVTRANTNLFDLGEALKYGGATAMDLNISLEESTAMVMALGNAGMQGSMAGVAMENSMRYLARAFSDFGSGPSKKALAILGLTIADVTDSSGDLLTMTTIIKKIGGALANLPGGNVQQQALLQSVFGVRGKRAGSLFIRNLQEFERFTGEIAAKSSGHASRIMKDMMSTLAGELKKTGSQWQMFWIEFTEAVEPVAKFLVFVSRKIGQLLTWVMSKPFLGEALATGIAGFIAINTVAFAFKAIISGIRLMQMQGIKIMSVLTGTTVAGYNQMTAAAMRFTAAQRMSAAASIGGMARRGVVGVNAAGGIYRTAAGRTGRAGQIVGAGVAARYAARFGMKQAGGRAAMGLGAKAAGASLAKIAGVLTGPFGLVLSFALPALIGVLVRAIKGNKSATEENSRALEEKNRMQVAGQGYTDNIIRFTDLDMPAMKVVGAAGADRLRNDLMEENMAYYKNTLTSILNKKVDQTIVINVGGEEAFRDSIEKYMFDNVDRVIGE